MLEYFKENKYIVTSLLAIILDGIILYYHNYYYNRLDLFYPMLTVSLIPYLYLDNKKNYYKTVFILGMVYDLLYSHIFLMYDCKSTGDNIASCLNKLNGLNNLYSSKVYYINKKPYYVYAFTTNNTIRTLKSGSILLTASQKKRVLQFWQWKDPWITNNILLNVRYDDPGKATIPEEDYAPDLADTKNGIVLKQTY